MVKNRVCCNNINSMDAHGKVSHYKISENHIHLKNCNFETLAV